MSAQGRFHTEYGAATGNNFKLGKINKNSKLVFAALRANGSCGDDALSRIRAFDTTAKYSV